MLNRSCYMFSTTYESFPWCSSTYPISHTRSTIVASSISVRRPVCKAVCSSNESTQREFTISVRRPKLPLDTDHSVKKDTYKNDDEVTTQKQQPIDTLTADDGKITWELDDDDEKTTQKQLAIDTLTADDEEKMELEVEAKGMCDDDDDETTNRKQQAIDTLTAADEEKLVLEVEEKGMCDNDGGITWEPDEMEAISSLFKGRVPQKLDSRPRQRPLPLPLPHKTRPLGLPTPKRFSNIVSRQSMSKQVYKNPTFLIGLAKEIQALSTEENVSKVLENWSPFLRKGSLSLVIRELGHLGNAERVLQTFSWVKTQPHLFPDDHVLASTIEVLARSDELKLPGKLNKFTGLASQSEYEAMLKGFIKGGRLKDALRLLSIAEARNELLETGVYAKLILELGKNPDKSTQVLALLEKLAARDDLNLTPQDCTAIMKICIRLGRYDIVEGLYDWFKKSGGNPNILMYTTLVHCRYSAKKYREALAVVWEMEASNCLFDLPAYRVAIKLFVALNDLSRAVRYFSKLKESGFNPTFDIYCSLIKIYMNSGRLAKCKEIREEAEMAGFRLDEHTMSKLSQKQ